MKIIARIYTGFPEKFGIPRQSGIVDTPARIVFEPEYRNPDALRGIEGYSHLWILWQFSQAIRDDWSPTVRPPRLGGNRRMGVFATRSPFRPNPIGLSSVRLLGVNETKDEGTVLKVAGADILDGTPIYDIKPYLAYTDSHPDAIGGFADEVKDYSVDVEIPNEILERIAPADRDSIILLLRNDPRPSYRANEAGEYGMSYAGYEISFSAERSTLKVLRIEKRNK